MEESKLIVQFAWFLFFDLPKVVEKAETDHAKRFKVSLCVVHIVNAAVFGICLNRGSDCST